MKPKIIAAALFAATLSASSLTVEPPAQAWTHGTALNQWFTLKIGGAGVADHLNVAANGDMAHCSDQVGAYLGSLSTPWLPISVYTRTPSVFTATGSQLQPNCESMGQDRTHTNNVWMLMTADGGFGTTLTLYRTLDRGVTVTKNASYPIPHYGFNGGTSKGRNPYINVDPNQSDVVYAATPSQGMWRAIDGTTNATFSPITDIGLGLPRGAPQSEDIKNTDSTLISTCTGTQTFSNPAGGTSWGYTTGQYVQVWETSAPVNAMYGTVNAASSGTSLVLDIIANSGTCSHSDWTVSVAVHTSLVHDTGGMAGGGNISAFDTSQGTQTVIGQIRTKVAYVCTFGVAIFQSTDGQQTWTDITTGTAGENSKYCLEMKVGGDATLYVMMDPRYSTTISTQPIYYFTTGSGPWVQPTGPPGTSPGWGESFDIDTINNNCATIATCHMVVFSTNYIGYTITGPATGNYHAVHTGAGALPVQASGIQPTWPVTYYNTGGFNRDFSSAKFVTGGDVYYGGEGVLFFTPSMSGTSVTLNVYAAGSEMSENTSLVFNPTVSSVPILTLWDLSAFYKTPLNAYPSTNVGPNSPSSSLVHGYGASFAPGTNTVFLLADNQTQGGGYISFSGYSDSGGQPGTWTKFTTDPKATLCAGAPCLGGAVCASSASNILVMPTSFPVSGNGTITPRFSADKGVTWSDVVITGATVTRGWPFHYSNTTTPCAADPTTPGKYYIYDWDIDGIGGGDAIFTCTTSGSTLTCAKTSHPQFNLVATTQFAGQLRVASNGDIWFTPGSQTATMQPRAVGMFISTAASGGASFSQTTDLLNSVTFGFGVSFPGKTYDTVAAVGWYTGTVLVNGSPQSVMSQYGSYMCKQFNSGTKACDSTWQLMGPDFFFGSGGWGSVMVYMDGDKIVPGLFGVVSQYGGGFYGQFNYLLNRDLNPAANDNSPAWLDKVG